MIDTADLSLKMGGKLNDSQPGGSKPADWLIEYIPDAGHVTLRFSIETQNSTDESASYETNLGAEEIKNLTEWLGQVALYMDGRR